MASGVKPSYWDEARAQLSRADPAMGAIIEACGAAHLVSRDDPFQTLARSIVGQQISLAAAQSVWNRFAAAAREITPDRVSRMREPTLRKCGLSQRKVEYLKDLSRRLRAGEMTPENWPAMDDEAVIGELVQVRGIGRWTAEMFLIFNLMRPDIYPLDDVGLLRGIAVHYGHPQGCEAPASLARSREMREHAHNVGERFRPWRSVATWYLWRSLDPVPVEY